MIVVLLYGTYKYCLFRNDLIETHQMCMKYIYIYTICMLKTDPKSSM